MRSARWELHQADCREVLRGLAPASCALLLTDIPYGLGDGETTAITRRGAKAIRRDFGEWDKGREAIEQLVTDMAQASATLVRARGAAYVWTSDILFEHVRELMRRHFGRPRTLTWCKTNPAPSMRQADWLSATEFCVYAHCPGLKFEYPGHAESFNWLVGPVVHAAHRTHPTEKPVWLWQRIISATTKPGDVVLDPFAGTGSSGEAALRLGRRWIGVELDPKYAVIAARRLKEVSKRAA